MTNFCLLISMVSTDTVSELMHESLFHKDNVPMTPHDICPAVMLGKKLLNGVGMLVFHIAGLAPESHSNRFARPALAFSVS